MTVTACKGPMRQRESEAGDGCKELTVETHLRPHVPSWSGSGSHVSGAKMEPPATRLRTHEPAVDDPVWESSFPTRMGPDPREVPVRPHDETDDLVEEERDV